MKTLVIFNRETGQIISTQSGSTIADGVISNISVTVPSGKTIDKYDTATGEIVYKDIPESDMVGKSELEKTNEKIDKLQAQLQETMAALDIVINGGAINNG